MVASRGRLTRATSTQARSTRVTRLGVAVLLAGALLTAPLLLGGCEIIISNTVDPFMPYVIGEIDLSSVLPRTSRETKIDVVLAGPDADIPVFVVLVRPDSAGADMVVMLEGAAPTVRVRQESTDITRFDTRPFRHLGGGVQIGNLLFNPQTLLLSNAPRLERDYRTILSWTNGYQLFGMESGTDLTFTTYDAGFTSEFDTGSVPLSTFGLETIAVFQEVDARNYFNPQIQDFFLFGFNDLNDRGEIWYFGIDYLEDDEILGPVQLQQSSLLPGTVQRTPAGFLGQDYDNKLVRMDLETGAVLDRFRPRHDDGHRSGPHEVTPIVFDPQGTFYLLLDQEKRILYKVAPWW